MNMVSIWVQKFLSDHHFETRCRTKLANKLDQDNVTLYMHADNFLNRFINAVVN